MSALAAVLLVFGIVIMVWGFFAYRACQDPLGYAPPFAAIPALVGALVLVAGIVIGRVAQ